MPSTPITTLFLDVGGVLLTNGWDHAERQRAAQRFQLDLLELNERHELCVDAYEKGLLTLDQYLDQIVFYQPRTFTRETFRQFMFDLSQPFPQMLSLIREVKARAGLKVAVLSNEGRELAEYRIKTFRLTDCVDFFIVSCFVHARKPEPSIYGMALDIAQVSPEQGLYIDDRALFVEMARNLGLQAIHHKSYEATRQALMGTIALQETGVLP